MTYIYSLKEIPQERLGRTGGKAASLSRMLKMKNITVPEGYVICADAFAEGKLLGAAEEELRALVSGLSSSHTYAVRSSALNEDGQDASFAGQYETLTDVPCEGIFKAVQDVAASSENARVTEYTRSYASGSESEGSSIAVVIQRFVRPQFAGVIFTSDVISGKDEYLTGNYVEGEGEKLVSGIENAKEFKIGSIRYSYEGPDEMKPYAKKLGKFCRAIRRDYGVPMDIEWAVSEKKVYILQARPITTLRRLNMETYEVNGSLSGYKLLTRTNVGEIFQKPITPMTFSVLEKINDILGLPDWLENISGQPYMNISVMCSMLVSFGKSRESAWEAIKDLAGNIPEGIEVPISPFDKGNLWRKVRVLLFPKEKSKLSKKEKKEMVEKLPDLAREHMQKIRTLRSNEELLRYWETVLVPALRDGLASVIGASGSSMLPLFSTRKKISKIAGEDMANRLCGGCVGVIDCMKPLLLLEDLIAGRITEDEYIHTCGQRCAGEMELMEPRPYEDPEFLSKRIEQHKKSNVNLHEMQKAQQVAFAEAREEFYTLYPKKRKWLDKQIASFARSNAFREDLRSRGVWIFSVYREFLLRTGVVNSLGDDVFMLTGDEVFDLLKGDRSVLKAIPKRKETFLRYQSYPVFPTLVLGRFEPDKWLRDENRRGDFYWDEAPTGKASLPSDVKGFAGAAGVVTGKVRVIPDISRIDEIEDGDILVTASTNIGWTLVFPRVSAIITDIGAPLSHAAIVAREFGIPAVVGCGNATTVLHTGDMVQVDGARGIVTRVEE
ncbi:MAG: hypothetical protein J6Y08_04605 [Clostridiales bacterium]|nr:hypothetical protein [Clostridiales bacterium]